MTLDQVSHTHPPCGVAHPLASRISSPRSFLPRLSFSPSLSEDPDLPEFSRRHQKRHGHLDVQSQISHALADESEDRLRRRRNYRYTPLVPRRKPLPPPVPLRDISQINFFLSLVNAKRELFSPLVIVGSQIFERPSGGRYGGRWISDGYWYTNYLTCSSRMIMPSWKTRTEDKSK